MSIAPEPPLVLVADNDPDVSGLLAEVLAARGVRVEVVGDGEAAVARLRLGGVDLLVCDLDMPELDGEGVLLALEDFDAAPPVLIVSGYVDEPTEARLRASAHLADVLRKPFDVLEFAARAHALALASPAETAAPPREVEA